MTREEIERGAAGLVASGTEPDVAMTAMLVLEALFRHGPMDTQALSIEVGHRASELGLDR